MLIYNVLLVSGIQQSEPVMHLHIKSISAWICKHSNVNQISGRDGGEGSGRETSELGDLISALLIL